MTVELWKDVPGYEDYYEISNQGRARSKDRIRYQRHCSGKVVPHLYRGRDIQLDTSTSNIGVLNVYDVDRQESFSMYYLVSQLFGQSCADLLYYGRDRNQTLDCPEEWRTVTNHTNYQVSDQGRVKRVNKTCEIVLQPWYKDGYATVMLSTEGNTEALLVHRIVATAFHLNPDNKPYVNHIDGNPSNNCANNLEWCTAAENMQHAYRTGLCTVNLEQLKHANAAAVKAISVKVYCPEVDMTFDSLSDAERYLGLKPSSAHYMLANNKTMKGYTLVRVRQEVT